MKFTKATLAQIAPGIGDHLKYSPRLFTWVRKNAHWDLEAYLVDRTPQLGKPDCLYIGAMYETGFSGRPLWQLLGAGRGMNGFYPAIRADNAPKVEDFWQKYIEGGRCYLDPEHQTYFIDERWAYPDDDHRECLWCGHKQTKVTFPIATQHTRWDNPK